MLQRIGADTDLAALGKLYGVADKVRQDLTQPSGIPDQCGLQRCRNKARQLEPLAACQFAEQLRHLFDNDPKIEWAVLDFDLAGLDLG